MKKRLKLQAAILVVIASSSYADESCLPTDMGSKELLEVFQCFEAKLNRQQKQIDELAAKNQNQQKRIAELEDTVTGPNRLLVVPQWVVVKKFSG